MEKSTKPVEPPAKPEFEIIAPLDLYRQAYHDGVFDTVTIVLTLMLSFAIAKLILSECWD